MLSNLATLNKRKGRANASIFEIGAMLNDVRMHTIGGLLCGLDIFNMAVIPMLLYNAKVFTEIDQETLKEFDKIQNLFLSILLAVPLSCPHAAMSWDTVSMSMENRIYEQKLNFICHLKELNDEALAKQIFNEQRENNWPGLAKEAKEICKIVYLPDITKKRTETFV